MSEKVKTPTRMLRYSKSWYLYSRYVFFVQKLFYKKITAEGLENIPMKTPLIYAPNHQNALLDPLLIIATCKRQIVFLTRADVFLNKFVTKFFNWLKILPVYQIREGRENLPKNYTSFDQIIDVLEHN
ncbi:MAG: hypothetical protein GX879_00575, partial [Bacteroidales bacterium]|nr:hypothetical protein [Bacteroidales bacterium]